MSFAVDLDTLEAAVARMTRFERTLDARLSELDHTLATLHETWSGQSAEAQAETHRRWRAAYGDLRIAMTKLREAGERAHSNYSGAASANTRMWAATR